MLSLGLTIVFISILPAGLACIGLGRWYHFYLDAKNGVTKPASSLGWEIFGFIALGGMGIAGCVGLFGDFVFSAIAIVMWLGLHGWFAMWTISGAWAPQTRQRPLLRKFAFYYTGLCYGLALILFMLFVEVKLKIDFEPFAIDFMLKSVHFFR